MLSLSSSASFPASLMTTLNPAASQSSPFNTITTTLVSSPSMMTALNPIASLLGASAPTPVVRVPSPSLQASPLPRRKDWLSPDQSLDVVRDVARPTMVFYPASHGFLPLMVFCHSCFLSIMTHCQSSFACHFATMQLMHFCYRIHTAWVRVRLGLG